VIEIAKKVGLEFKARPLNSSVNRLARAAKRGVSATRIVAADGNGFHPERNATTYVSPRKFDERRPVLVDG